MTTLLHSYFANTWIKRSVLSPWFWVVLCGLLFAHPLVRSINRPLPPSQPVLYQLPSYQLLNQYGQPFGTQSLKGRFYIANFFFTSCPTICPKLLETMQAIQHRVRGLGTNIALVSFSVDPATDRPQKLLRYSKKYHANPHIWYFLTGGSREVHALVEGGFKLAMGEPIVEGGSLYDIAHSAKLVLVDYAGRIRGFYASDQEGINQLMIDLGLLANREKAHLKNS